MRNTPSFLWSLIILFGVTQPVLSQTPVTLRQVLDSVLGNHPMVQAARARVRAARGAKVTAGAFGNPEFSYSVENAALPGRLAPPMDRETRMSVMLPAESFFQRWSRAARASANVRAAEADSTNERQRLGIDAARAFYRVALAQVATAAARDVASWLDSVVVYNAARVDEGVASEGDLIRAQVERDRAAAEATLQEADLVRARSELAAWLGDPTPPGAGPVVAIENAPLSLAAAMPRSHQDSLSDDGPLAFMTRALALRPDVRAARERVAGARAGVASE
jgi:outer membrane protein TolC